MDGHMLDFIKEILASFRQTSLERVKSPVLGAFVFSWLGFNWQMVAIAMFSDKSMESRIEYINQRFDIGDYLFGPICVTALICVILPQINKAVMKIQGKPNAETFELSLDAKIAIAQKQQELAEADARKKLAERKEEKFIEQDIYLTKQKNKELIIDLQSLRNRNHGLESNLQTITVEKNSLEKQLNDKIIEISSITRKFDSQNDANSILEKEKIKLKNELSEKMKSLERLSESIGNGIRVVNEKDSEIQKYHDLIIKIRFNQENIIKNYPQYFEFDEDNDLIILVKENLINDYKNKYKLR